MIVYFMTDKERYNRLYRASLMHKITESGNQALSIGVFDSSIRFISAIRLLFFKSGFFVSSNLRANFVSCLFPRNSGLVILNGFGRARHTRWIRVVLANLFRCNTKKNIAAQNYADYRYLRRYFRPDVAWVPGSGGTPRAVGCCDRVIVVSRDSKLGSVKSSIFDFMGRYPDTVINLVGCSDDAIAREGLGCPRLFSSGYVNQGDIFVDGNCFMQPDGYGEGVPHTLVDAIESEMLVFVSRRQVREFGLEALGLVPVSSSGQWVELSTVDYAGALSKKCVDQRYLSLLTLSQG